MTSFTQKHETGINSLKLATLAVFALSVLLSVGVRAQTANVSLSGLPATPLIGEQFCVDASFTNGSATTGYGPYLIAVVDPGIQQISVDFVDIEPRVEQIGVFDASGTLEDPISGTTLNGVEGGSAWLARYPIGSVDQGQPALVMNVCAVVEPGAEINTPLNVEVTPGFEFGDTTVGTNGPILGAPQASTVTPQLARIAKSNTAPEGERPPGPSHPFAYTWSVDISQGVAIENLDISDVLPANIQWTEDPIVVTAPLGVNCTLASTPATIPTGGGTVTVTCDSVLGAASTDDLTVSVPVYINDTLDASGPDSQSITNTVNFAYDFQGDSFTDSATSTVQAVLAAAQKTVSGTGLPGGRLTYVISFQLTDYIDGPPAPTGANSFTISDVIPDGLQYDGTVALVINNGVETITESVSLNDPSAGETTVVWDIAAAVGGVLPNGATGTLTFETTILDNYANGDPVLASDPFLNQPNLNYALTEGGSGSDVSEATASIQPNVSDKRIVSPNPVPAVLEPGTVVVYELSMSIPAGNTSDIVFTDFLPRPVFDVGDFNAATDLEVLPPFASLTPAVSVASGNNSIRMDFGDITTPVATTLRVNLTARIVGTPFADSLFLTNLLQTSYTNTAGTTIEDLQAVGSTVGAPSLVITKGVISTDNSAAQIQPAPPGDPSQALADSDVNGVDAFDVIDYVLTIENVGSTPAYNVTIDEPAVTGLSCAEPSPGDLVNGAGTTLSFSGDLASGIVIDGELEENDGTEGAPYGRDTALLSLSCTLGATVEPRQTITNEAGVVWTSIPDPGSPFPRVSDTADAVIADPTIRKSLVEILPDYNAGPRRAQIGQLITYEVEVTVPEGRSSSVRVEDILANGFAFVDVLSITPSSPDLSSSAGGFADILANNAGFNSQGGGATAPDRRLVFGPGNGDSGFGNVTNANTDNNVDETLTIRYRARVINASVNTAGRNKRNRARWLWQTPGQGRQNIQARAPAVRIVEPQLQVQKIFTPDEGDDSTPPQFSITLNHRGGSSADAFDLLLSDTLPAGMLLNGATVDNSACANPPDNELYTGSPNPSAFEFRWDRFNRGDSCTLTFQTLFPMNPSAGQRFENCGELFWESLPDIDQPLPMPPNNTLGVERTGMASDPGQLNNYRLQACDLFSVFGLGISKNLVSTDQPHTDNIAGTPAGAESLTIGELATFEIVVTVPDADVENLLVTDLLPVTDNVLELVSARTLSVGADLTPQFPNPAAVPVDRDSDGVNDNVELNFGDVTQVSNGITDENDRIRIEVVARVKDVLVNRNNNRSANDAVVRYSDNLIASDSFDLEIVEPLLQIGKTADRSEAEAGDVVTYTIRIAHDPASRIDAKDVELSDLIPAELNVIPASVTTGDTCSATPDAGPQFSGGAITASWTTLARSDVCEIEFQATVDISAVIGQPIINESEVTWTSLEGQGDADDRNYDLSDAWTLGISEPGLDKQMTATDIDETDFAVASATQALTIGETATFTITADFSDGTTEQVVLRDEVPNVGVALQITGSRIVAIGGDLTLSSGANIGDPAIDCTGGGVQTCAEWVLGDVVNLPDARPDPDSEDAVVVEIDVIVLDDPANSGAPGEDKNLRNLATLTGQNVSLNASSNFDLIEPQLELQKLTPNGALPAVVGAGERVSFTLEISHAAVSTAPALNIVVTDTLNAQMDWVSDGDVVSDCPGFNPVDSSNVAVNGEVVFSFAALDLPEQGCSITYPVDTSTSLPIPGVFPNEAELTWESAPGSAESRAGTAEDSNSLFSVSDASITKVVTGTSVPGTSTGVASPLLDDVTIGERISYRIVTAFTEGTTSNVRLVDVLELNGANGPTLERITESVVFVGDQISTTLPGVPTFDGTTNTIELNFGDVTNVSDGISDENDTIVFEVVARVIDLPNNVAGITLSNDVRLTSSGAPETATVDVDVVEPDLSATKAFTDLTEGVARIELTVSNTGTSDAYELIVTDEFDETFWLPGTLTPITVPDGFTLTEASAGGVTTVTLATEGNPAKPEEVLAPGESVSIAFSMELINGGIVGVTQIDNVAEVEATSLPGVDPAERTYTTTATDSLFFPDLDLLKTWSGPNDPAVPGDIITYTLTLENNGDAPATNVLIEDTPDSISEFIPGSVNAPGGTVTSGNSPGDTTIAVEFVSVPDSGSVTVSYQVRVPLPYPAGILAPEQLENQATADAKEQQGIVSDDPTTGTVDDPTRIRINVDVIMVVSKVGQAQTTGPGVVIDFLITYGNVGNQDATGVVITETVPDHTVFVAADSTPGWSCADGSPPGTSCELSIGDVSLESGTAVFAVLVDDPLPAGVNSIDNTVEINDDGLDFGGVRGPVSEDDGDAQVPTDGAFPQLTISKDDGGIFVTPGQRFSYLIDYANVGNQGATGVVVSETVPEDVTFSAAASAPTSWSCPDGSPAGTVCTFTVPLLIARESRQANFGLDVVLPAAAGRDLILNNVEITDDGNNSLAPSTDQDTDDTPLIAVPDIYVSKTPDLDVVEEGGSLVYTASYGNQGNQNATGVVITETVPEGAAFNAGSSAPTAWSCSDGAPAGTVCEYQGGAVPAGFMETLLFAIDIVDTPSNRRVVNLITAFDDMTNGPEPTPDDNSDEVSTLFPSLSIDTMSRGGLLLTILMILGIAAWQRRASR
ncbi:MAG: hypothetical protein Cons2KO_25600 [Congregibacter sp.]